VQKIEFGDINKFLVSIGIVLIGLAILTPYLYLKEDFGLNIESEKILKFDQEVQQIFTNKKNQISTIQSFIPWTSAILLGLGILISGIGINRWLKRQSKIDEKFDKEIQILDIEIQASSPEEKIENAKKEVKEIELAEELESEVKPVLKPKNQSYINYMKIEKNLFDLFKNMDSPNFKVYQEPKIGDRFYIDILLKANSIKYSDRIIEIKYFRNQLPISTIQKSLHQLSTYISYYRNNTNKRVIPILLLVYKDEILNKDRLDRYKERIEFFAKDIPELTRLKTEFIAESKLEKFDVKKLLKK
tara:strand:- start:2552 stop:3457 length:906 start_codon:yes stop_codon:yes gene_type:complete